MADTQIRVNQIKSGALGYVFDHDIHEGDAVNFANVAVADGQITWGGTYKKKLTMRPSLVAGRIVSSGKPTSVVIGAHAGYILPIWSTPANQYEELYFRDYVPGRWDGATDITASIICVLDSAETIGHKFQLQVSWENKETSSGVITTGTTDVPVETTIATARNAQYSIYKVEFTIDYDGPTPNIAASDHVGFRLRRIAASGSEITGNPIIIDAVITYTIDKVYKTV